MILATLAGIMAAPTALADTNALDSAKTLQAKATVSLADRGGHLSPFAYATIKIVRPNQVYVLLVPADKTKKLSFYVSDGKTEHEYNGYSNSYRTLPPPSQGPPSQMRTIVSTDEILEIGKQMTAGASPGRTVADDMLDGVPALVRTDTQPPQRDHDGAAVVYSDKIWVAKTTGFPLRRTAYKTVDGVTTPTLQEEFSDWSLGKSIAPATFAFNPPAGSVPFSIPTPITQGKIAPEFAVLTPDGKTVHLSDFKGKTLVIDLWATWCGPCQDSMPHLEQVYQQLKSRPDVALLAICVWDEKDEYTHWVAKNIGSKYTFPVAFDPAAKDQDKSFASKLYHVSGIPTQFVIDKDGRITATIVGYDRQAHKLEDALAKLGVSVANEPTGVPSGGASR
jgi:thiol-disulfide isomerase/thioredoxin